MANNDSADFYWDEIALADCPFENFHRAYDYWNKLRGERLAPAWTDVDLLDLKTEMITHICVVDVQEDSPPFPYRFYGSSLTRLHNLEMSRKTTASIKPERYRRLCEAQYGAIITAQSPILFVGKIRTEAGIVREHYNLRFPLSDDGQRVTNIITIEKYDEDVPDLKDFYSSFNP